MIELLGPEHASKRLAHDVLRISRKVLRDDRRVELVGFLLARSENVLSKLGKGVRAFDSSESVRRKRTTTVSPAPTVSL